jgi:hypothetical protein
MMGYTHWTFVECLSQGSHHHAGTLVATWNSRKMPESPGYILSESLARICKEWQDLVCVSLAFKKAKDTWMVKPCFLKVCCQSIYLTTPICWVQVTIQSLLLRAINKGHDPKPLSRTEGLISCDSCQENWAGGNSSLLINSMGDIPQKLVTDVPSLYDTCAFEDNP